MEESSHRVVILGAGYISAPVVKYLNKEQNVHITIASALKEEADAIASKFKTVSPVLLDVIERPDILQELVKNADVVISLLPNTLHHIVAECCIEQNVNMVTASYCTPELREMHDKAVENGVTIVNEVGLDPGIDHLLAMECFDEVHQAGGKVESFVSYCGGLPAPECSDNALGYKFSWNPRGVLLNTLSTAKYIKNNEVIEIPGGGQLMKEAVKLDFLPGFSLEGFPNRDSTYYASLYGIMHEAHTVLRGTLRFQGFSDTIQGLHLLGLFDTNPHPALHPKGPDITWRQLVCTLLGQTDSTIFYENLKTKVEECVGSKHRVEAIETLGILEDNAVLKLNTPFSTITHFLSKKLYLDNNERDLVILRHELGILWPDGRREIRGINLVSYGEPGCSAMSRTVGIPTAIAAKMVLDGEIQKKGMVLPFTPDIYRPMLSRLRAEGLVTTEKSKFVN